MYFKRTEAAQAETLFIFGQIANNFRPKHGIIGRKEWRLDEKKENCFRYFQIGLDKAFCPV
jgi:hypothetical protein